MNSTGTVVSIYGNKATIRVASSTALLKAIPIVGDASSIAVGSRVPLQTIDNRVVVIAEGGGSTTIVAAPSSASSSAGLAAHLLDPNAHPQYAAKAQTETITGIWTLGTSTPLRFRDAALAILSSADGQLDIDADITVEVTSPTIELVASTKIATQSPLLEFNQAARITTTSGFLHIEPLTDLYLRAGGSVLIQDVVTSASVYIGKSDDAAASSNLYLRGGSVSHRFLAYTSGNLYYYIPTAEAFRITNPIGADIAVFTEATKLTTLQDLDVVTTITTPKIDTVSGNLLIAPATNVVTVTGNILPSADSFYSLGTADAKWNEMWVDELYVDAMGVGSSLTINYSGAPGVTPAILFEHSSEVQAYITWDGTIMDITRPLRVSGALTIDGMLNLGAGNKTLSAGGDLVLQSGASNHVKVGSAYAGHIVYSAAEPAAPSVGMIWVDTDA